MTKPMFRWWCRTCGAVLLAVLLSIPGAMSIAQSGPAAGDPTAQDVDEGADERSEATTEPERGCNHGRQRRSSAASSESSRPTCGQGKHRRQGAGSRGASGGHRPEMELAHFLIDNHDRLTREIEMLENGVRTTTTAADVELVDALRSHVRQMAALLEDGGRIRNWDPLFRQIFDHRDAIELEITDIENGVQVVEISADRSVAQLIQAHARKVDEFVSRGLEAYHEETALPEGYLEAGS